MRQQSLALLLLEVGHNLSSSMNPNYHARTRVQVSGYLVPSTKGNISCSGKMN